MGILFEPFNSIHPIRIQWERGQQIEVAKSISKILFCFIF